MSTGGRLPWLALCALLAARCSGPASAPPTAGRSQPPSLQLHPGRLSIPIDWHAGSARNLGDTPLDSLSREELRAYRVARVHVLSRLGVFPADYDPLTGERSRIWVSVEARTAWLGPTAHYVGNPYLLVALTAANHVSALDLFCPAAEVHYENGRLEQTVRGEPARCWFRTVYEPPYAEYPGRVRVVAVNAQDAGFGWLFVDTAASLNVETDADAGHITRAAHRDPCFFHVGRYGRSNLSPEDRRAWLTLQARDVQTRVAVKLWREQPASVGARAELTYVFEIDPTAG